MIFSAECIHNAQTKGVQHKSMVKPEFKGKMAAPPAQFVALQAFNTLKETIRDMEDKLPCSENFTSLLNPKNGIINASSRQ